MENIKSFKVGIRMKNTLLNCDTMEMRVVSIRHELIAWYERHGYHNTGKIIPFPDDPLSIKTQPLEFIQMEKSL